MGRRSAADGQSLARTNSAKLATRGNSTASTVPGSSGLELVFGPQQPTSGGSHFRTPKPARQGSWSRSMTPERRIPIRRGPAAWAWTPTRRTGVRRSTGTLPADPGLRLHATATPSVGARLRPLDQPQHPRRWAATFPNPNAGWPGSRCGCSKGHRRVRSDRGSEPSLSPAAASSDRDDHRHAHHWGRLAARLRASARTRPATGTVCRGFWCGGANRGREWRASGLDSGCPQPGGSQRSATCRRRFTWSWSTRAAYGRAAAGWLPQPPVRRWQRTVSNRQFLRSHRRNLVVQ